MTESAALTPHFEAGATSGYYDVATENLLTSPHVRAAAGAINRVGGNVLDIGCGRGAFATLLTPTIDYTGFDISLDKDSTESDGNRTVSWGDACRPFPYPDGAFRHVVSFWCLEHLPAPRVMLGEAARVLGPGGTLHLVFPNYDNPLRRCPSWWCDKGKDPTRGDDSMRTLLRRPRPVNAIRQLYRRAGYLVRQVAKQVWIDLTGSPVFEINSDPAYLHLPWARDRDAIHVVSGRSVAAELRQRGLAVRRIRPGDGATGLPLVGPFFRREAEYHIEAEKP